MLLASPLTFAQALLQLGEKAPFTLKELHPPYSEVSGVDSCMAISSSRLAIRLSGEKGFRLYTAQLKPIGNSLTTSIAHQMGECIPFAFGSDWGIADTNGNVKVKPRFDEIIQMHQGKILVRKGNQYGVVGLNGKWQLKLSDDEESARKLLQPQLKQSILEKLKYYDKVYFEDGDSIVRITRKERFGFMDLRWGMLIAEPQFEAAGPFRYGNAVVKTENGYTLMNALGKQCPMQYFDFISDEPTANRVFHNGEGEERWMGLLGDHCEILVPGAFHEIGVFYGWYARCSHTGISFNYMDQKGDEVFPKQHFTQAENPLAGYGVVLDKNTWKVLDLTTADPRSMYESATREAFQLIPLH